jgi:hypothetical protein
MPRPSTRDGSLEATHAILGVHQNTPTTAQTRDGKVIPIAAYQGENLFGDATVPLVGACRPDIAMDSNTLRRVPDKHGNLQRNPPSTNSKASSRPSTSLSGPTTTSISAFKPPNLSGSSIAWRQRSRYRD